MPRYNIAPSQRIPIVRINSDGRRIIDDAEWGFIPSWTKGKPKLKPINAKGETVATSGMFRQAFNRRRCLVPADGFFEWHGSKPPKQPYFIHRPDDSIFAFAGLYERWKSEPDAEPVETCTIITTTPNDVMKPIHNRMPVILRHDQYAEWLDPATPPDKLQAMLTPFSGKLEAYRISTRVNKPANDDPSLIEQL